MLVYGVKGGRKNDKKVEDIIEDSILWEDLLDK